jgi:cytochrome c5
MLQPQQMNSVRTPLHGMAKAVLALFFITQAGGEPAMNERSYEPDHAGIIQSWDEQSFRRGQKLYNAVCLSCHGNLEQPGSIPESRPFWLAPFKQGNDPYSLYRTITEGLGQMPAWPWLTPELRYDVIHFLREAFVKPHNPGAYFEVTPEYLAGLPQAEGEFRKSRVMEEWEKGPPYLRMDFGPMLMWTIEAAPGNIAQKGIAIRLDEGRGGISRGRAWMLYDQDTLRAAAAWTGEGFIDWRGIAFDGSHGTHAKIAGDPLFLNPPGPGWAEPCTGQFADPRPHGRDDRPYGPLPRDWAHYKGVYLHGSRVIIAYTVGQAAILESPGLEPARRPAVVSRTLNIGKSPHDLWLRVAPDSVPVALAGGESAALISTNGFYQLRVPAQATPLNLKILIGENSGEQSWDALLALALVTETPEDLRPLTKGGPLLWKEPVRTQVRPLPANSAFAVDDLVAPNLSDNPWNAWMRLGGFDFFPDGNRAAVCTWNGDVWVVEGIAESSNGITWRRIASGLFQPLGLRIVDGLIYVACRDQIARLHDLNGNGAIDYIENFNNDHQVTEHFHEFAMGLETDEEGNFYYAKAARHALPAVAPQHGTLLRVSPDGSNTTIVASGFRAPNGVCLNPDGTFFVTDQEGHWIPKNRVNHVREGGFYGNMWSYHAPESSADEAMEPPLVWITNEMDRSPAELRWVTSEQWGPLRGALLNFSYGAGRIFAVLPEVVNGTMQGGVAALPIPDFPTGIMRGRFHPETGDLFLAGMYAWAGNQHQDGGFYRVRPSGKPLHFPIGLNVFEGAIQVTFTDAVSLESASNPSNYSVRIWGLRRSEKYGSPHLNERALEVVAAELSPDFRSVLLSIPELAPTDGMEIRFSLQAADGTWFERRIHNTIHQLAPCPPEAANSP